MKPVHPWIEWIPQAGILLFFCGLIALWFWTLLHIIKRRDLSLIQKLLWLAIVTLFHVPGMLAYAALSRPSWTPA
jgi:hypothetical protein